jgi:hypothetical protein
MTNGSRSGTESGCASTATTRTEDGDRNEATVEAYFR